MSARETIFLFFIMVIGSVLRVYRLDFQSLWTDEGWQYFVANANSIGGVLDRLVNPLRSGHPPLSYLINHWFLLARSSDFMLRLPSVLFGIGSLPLCYSLARKLTSRHAAAFTVLVLALSPLHIWYSQEGRMYAQLIFLLLLSSVLLIKAIQQSKWYWWGLYAVVVAAGMYTHLFMSLGVLAHCLWVLLCHRQSVLSYSASGVTAALLFLPWVHFFLRHFEGSGKSIGSAMGFSWAALPYTFFVYAAGFSLGPSVAELHENRNFAFLVSFFPVLLTVGLTFAVLFAVGIRSWYTYCCRQSLLLCLLGLCVPLAAALLFAMIPRSTFNVRYTVVAFPYFCMVIGMALAFCYRKNTRVGVLAVLAVIGISAVSCHNYYTSPRYAKEDVRSAVAFWRHASDNEHLLSNARHTVDRYLDASEKRQHFPILKGEESVVPAIDSFFATHGNATAYILLNRDWHQVRENAIRKVFSVEQEQAYPGVRVFRISRP